MPEPWHPHEGQRKAVKFLVEHAAAALFASPGTGKTSAVYAAFKYLKNRGLAKRMLVIAPLRPCHLVWGPEQAKWSDFKDIRVEVLHGPKKDEALGREADVYVINPDGLDWLLGAETVTKVTKTGKVKKVVEMDIRAFKDLGFDTLVLDELTLWKSTQTVRHQSLRKVLHTFHRRWGLTGTPAPNGLMDLFGQCYVLDMGKAFGLYITHYRNTYFLPSYDGFSWVLQKGAEERIYEKLKPLALRLAAEDYVDMPDLVENVIKFDLPDKARKIYDALEDDMIAKIGTLAVTASNAAAVSGKCRQVASGGLYLDDLTEEQRVKMKPFLGKGTARDWALIHEEKTELLADLIEELQGTPLLVAYDFQHDLERLRKRFGSSVPVIGGGTSTKRASELEGLWNAGKLPLLLGHPQSIGHGLNLQNAGNHVCWYSPTWNLELYDQFNRRVRRQGSKHSRVFVHWLVARDTVDEMIFWALRAKAKTQDALLLALNEFRPRKVKR